MKVSADHPLEILQTRSHSQLLDVVDGLRAQGLSNFLPLPQLIVCGDQSSGKSSVLEAICGVPFPKKDNLCTRFATEVILRRNLKKEEIEAYVSIRPGQDRSEIERENLNKFSKTLKDVKELPEAIQTAKDALGLGSQGGNAFATDVLRLEITGRAMPQLTIVDLPGLIHSENKFQTARDVDLVSELVQSYMKQSRSIILAVVSAKNDYANQIVLQRARETDRTGQRTLGIITKPDTLHANSDTERGFIGLAKNTDVVFKLGWHVVRNVDTNDPDADEQSRDETEESFFQHSNWRALGRSVLGISTLRDRLSNVLFEQITRELPTLIQEIDTCKNDCHSALGRLGRLRETEADQRLYVAELNQDVQRICRAGCDGNYDDAFFRETDSSLQPIEIHRLRASIQNQSIAFSKKLETSGARWQISKFTNLAKGKLTEDAAIDRVIDLIQRSRGRELPGTYNPLLISELFNEYSSPWEAMSRDYVTDIWRSASQFLENIVRHLSDEHVFDSYIHILVKPAMDEILAKANKALDTLFEERTRHATTYNHYFTETVEARRNERLRERIRDKLLGMLNNDGEVVIPEVEISAFAQSITTDAEPDMDRTAARDIYDKMQAYYRVALKRVVDNIPILVIESVIVRGLQEAIQPIHAWKMTTATVQEIAGESDATKNLRQQFTTKFDTLTKAEAICKRHSIHVVEEIGATSPEADSDESVSPSEVSQQESATEPVPGAAGTDVEASDDERHVVEPYRSPSPEIEVPAAEVDTKEDFSFSWGSAPSKKKTSKGKKKTNPVTWIDT